MEKVLGNSSKEFHNIMLEYQLSIPSIQRWLNNNPDHYKTALKFSNKGTLRPIESSTVTGRNQIDLVDYSKKPCIGRDGHTYKYVLSVLDVFSRMLFIRPLQAKTAVFVADQLKQIYAMIGRPKIIQCDNGGEFHGAVDDYCRRHQIKVIRSSPYMFSQFLKKSFTGIHRLNIDRRKER